MKRLLALARPLVERFPRVAATYRTLRDQTELSAGPVTTPWGFKLVGNPTMAKGGFEQVETELIREKLQEVDVLVNIGANIGYYCCHALSLGKEVIAFEPLRRNLNFLCKNVDINNWSEIEIFPMALANSIGVVRIYGNDTGASMDRHWAGASETYSTLVPCTRLDSVLGDRLCGRRSLIVMDVERAEHIVLEGAASVLRNQPRPIWVVEIAARIPGDKTANSHYASTFEIFFQNGYNAYQLNKSLKPVSKEEVRSVSDGSERPNTHNFLFE